MDDENGGRIIVEMPSYPVVEGTTLLVGQTCELDPKGDILLIINCPLSLSNNVKCSHHRDTGKAGEGPIAADLTIP